MSIFFALAAVLAFFAITDTFVKFVVVSVCVIFAFLFWVAKANDRYGY